MRRGKRSLSRSLNAIALEQRRAENAALAAQRVQLRNKQIAAKLASQGLVAARTAEAEGMTETLESKVHQLSTILSSAANQHFALDFTALKAVPTNFRFDAGGSDEMSPAPVEDAFKPQPLNFLQKLIPALVTKHEQAVANGEEQYRQASAQHDIAEKNRQELLLAKRAAFALKVEAEKRCVEELNGDLETTRLNYEKRVSDAVIDYFSMVLDDDVAFDNQVSNHRIAYVPESGQLVIEYQLPGIEEIPVDVAYKYVKKSDKIESTARKVTEIRKLYRDVVAQLACRVLCIVLSADTAHTVDVIAFNGFVDTIDPGTGKRITPTLVTVRASTSELAEIDFSKVDPIACLAGLKALVSRNAHELDPVRPIVNFNMVDPRFIDKTDVLSELDSRPNIADLSPSEFESLMTNLFEKMGLETRLTQASRDGGVDCVAWDMRPIIGGKVVIQAKRYKNTVGVSAVRDLFGTMMNEGAAKGILVTTSGFGSSAYEFAKNKPIELITGSNLLAMLSDYAGITAKIEFPQDWQDKDNLSEAG